MKLTGEVVSRPRGLDDLDILGEALIKQNLPTSAKHQPSFQKQPDKIPLNELARKKAQNELVTTKENLPTSSSASN